MQACQTTSCAGDDEAPAPRSARTMRSIAGKIIFYPSLGWNLVMERFTSRDWYNRIDEHVLLGALPFRSMLGLLKEKESVRAILSLNMQFELNARFYPSAEEMSNAGVAFHNLQVEDFVGTPNLEQVTAAVQFIEDQSASGGSVYVHCKAGRYRSATIACCYAIKRYAMPPKEAVEFVRKKRSHIVVFRRQMTLLEAYHRSVNPNAPSEGGAIEDESTTGTGTA